MLTSFFDVVSQLRRVPTPLELFKKTKFSYLDYRDEFGTWEAFCATISKLLDDVDLSNLTINSSIELCDAFESDPSFMKESIESVIESVESVFCVLESKATMKFFELGLMLLESVQATFDVTKQLTFGLSARSEVGEPVELTENQNYNNSIKRFSKQLYNHSEKWECKEIEIQLLKIAKYQTPLSKACEYAKTANSPDSKSVLLTTLVGFEKELVLLLEPLKVVLDDIGV